MERERVRKLLLLVRQNGKVVQRVGAARKVALLSVDRQAFLKEPSRLRIISLFVRYVAKPHQHVGHP